MLGRSLREVDCIRPLRVTELKLLRFASMQPSANARASWKMQGILRRFITIGKLQTTGRVAVARK